MKPLILTAALFIVGLSIVVACGVLFVQCTRIAEQAPKSENLFAQAVLDDVISNLLHKYPNGIRPADLRWELYSRVTLYVTVGFALIGAAAFRQYHFWTSDSQDTTVDSASGL